MKRIVILLSALSLVAGAAAPAVATPCKDKKGKFVKCPVKPKMCRSAKGHFAKC